jgi:hypothetical protein
MDPQTRTLQALIDALLIFRKYGNPKWPTNTGHDVLYVKGPEPDKMTPEDVGELDRLNFNWDEDIESWSSYVFGSC